MMQRFRRKSAAITDTMTLEPVDSSGSDWLSANDENDEKYDTDAIALAHEPAAFDNKLNRRPPRQHGAYVNAFKAARLKNHKNFNDSATVDAPAAPPAPPVKVGAARDRNSSLPRRQTTDSVVSFLSDSNTADENNTAHTSGFPVIQNRRSSLPIDRKPSAEDVDDLTPIEAPSATANLFQGALAHELRPVLGQAKAGVDMSSRVAIFIQEIADLQLSFSNRLNQIIETEMVRFAVNAQTDGMEGIRDMWVQAVEDSQSWASSSKDMASSLLKLAEPLKKQVRISTESVTKIIAENDRMSTPIPDLQTSIAKRQIKCNKLLVPLLSANFRDASHKSQQKKIEKARPQVVSYLDELYDANEWLYQIKTHTRPRMLNEMQRLEEQRINSTRKTLSRYSASLKNASKVMYKTSSSIERRLSTYHVDDDIKAFVEQMLQRPSVQNECFSPFVYRLPVSMYELGIEHKLENQIRRFQGREEERQHVEHQRDTHETEVYSHESSSAEMQNFRTFPELADRSKKPVVKNENKRFSLFSR